MERSEVLAARLHVQQLDRPTADRALTAKAALFHRLGVRVHLCGDAVIVGS